MGEPESDAALPPIAAPPQEVTPQTMAAALIPQELAATRVEDPRVVEALATLPQITALAQSGQFAKAALLAGAVVDHVSPAIGEDASGLAELVATYFRFQQQSAAGSGKLKLSACNEALVHFQQAIWIARDELLPLAIRNPAGGLKPEVVALHADMVQANSHAAQLMQAFQNESFTSAVRRTGQVVQAWSDIAERLEAMDIPEADKRLVRLVGESESATAGVFGRFAEAEAARQARAWDDALAGYDAVEEMLRVAGQRAVRLKLPVAMDAQQVLLNSTLVPTARRRLAENQALVEEGVRRARELTAALEVQQRQGDAWKAAVEALRGVAPTVNIHNLNELNASITVMAQVTQVARERVVDDLGDLARAIAVAPLPEGERRTLIDRIAALEAGKEEKGDGFFKKVAAFAEDAAKVLKNVTEAAEPMGKVVRWVAPFAPAAAALFGLR